jgi:transposase
MEATGSARWFERLLAECGHQLRIADLAQVRAAAPRRDADLLLQLLLEERFPRLTEPTAEERDARQVVLHHYRLVQMRTR